MFPLSDAPIIPSLLDTDLYKLTMMQAVFHQHPHVNVEYEFKNRTGGVNLLSYKEKIETEIASLCNTLRFQSAEIEYLTHLPFMKRHFLDLLQMFQLNPQHVSVYDADGRLGINIKGGWLYTILFETPILALISEIYARHKSENSESMSMFELGERRLLEKIELIREVPDFKFADFGTRRRFNRQWQEHVITTLIKEVPTNFVGTSNVAFAKQFGIKPIGTMAHEWLQAGQGMQNIRVSQSQKVMLQSWVNEYRGKLGIALTDVIGIDAFLIDFDDYFAKLYDGVRHDSGDPYIFGDKIIHHYERFNIDPLSKTIVFSDGLNFKTALEILEYFRGRIQVAFGIGTNLMNDFPQYKALQIVLKMTKCNGNSVAKISDTDGKTMCTDEKYLAYLKNVFAEKSV